MQASIFKKKGSSHVITCPRCGADNLTSQSHCGKCGFLFPKDEKDAHGKKNSPFGGSGAGGAKNSFGGSSGAGGAGAPASPPRALGGVPISQGTEGQVAQIDEQGNPIEAPKILTAHQKMDTRTEGAIMERGKWMKCPRCFADVKSDSPRCMHCGMRFGKK